MIGVHQTVPSGLFWTLVCIVQEWACLFHCTHAQHVKVKGRTGRIQKVNLNIFSCGGGGVPAQTFAVEVTLLELEMNRKKTPDRQVMSKK